MSHLLSSINPQAAAEIHPGPERQRLPGVGETVVYHMRQGFGRMGRTRFPALVQGHGERDTLMLTVFVDASDMMDESLVEEIGPGHEFHVWERLSAVRSLAERLEEPAGLRGEVKSLETAVFGDYDRPRMSLIDILSDFEQRLRTVKLANDVLRKDLTAAESLISKLSKKK